MFLILRFKNINLYPPLRIIYFHVYKILLRSVSWWNRSSEREIPNWDPSGDRNVPFQTNTLGKGMTPPQGRIISPTALGNQYRRSKSLNYKPLVDMVRHIIRSAQLQCQQFFCVRREEIQIGLCGQGTERPYWKWETT